MNIQPPSPPSITPQQMNLLRVVAAMAWADGDLAPEEVQVMLDRLSGLFAVADGHQEQLKLELQDYLQQNIPLEELIYKLESQADKALVLKLGYEVIYCSSRTPDEPNINMQEAAAYQQLVKLLTLPPGEVSRLEAEAMRELDQIGTVVDAVSQGMGSYIRGH